MMPELALWAWVAIFGVAVFSGLVKGVVGFGLPTIMISGFAAVLEPELALAGLIIPAFLTNAWQALRDGGRSALAAAQRHWRYILVMWVMIALSAQLVFVLSDAAMFLVLGVPVTLFAALQIAGWHPRIAEKSKRMVELVTAMIAGFIGAFSGVWGPPTVFYLTALDTPKTEQMRVQGLVYGSGAAVLLLAHIKSGVLNFSTAPFSALLVLPALLGLALGFRIQDRIDQTMFRRATLVVLIVAGLNLVRRGLLAI